VFNIKQVKVICHKATSPSHTDGSVVFTRWREGTLAPHGEYDTTCASFCLPESTTQKVNWSVQPFLHSWWQKVPILYNGRPFSP